MTRLMEERLEKHRDFLVDRIDPDFGLLDKLRANKTLTTEDVNEIKLNVNTTERKNRILLELILKNKKVDELIIGLRDIGQNHLVNYLNSDGEHESAFGDDWPLTEFYISLLNTNRESLVDLLDTRDLCIILFSEGVINNRQKQFISSKPTDAEKNEALLDILTKCSLRQYKNAILCLNDSNQGHIAKTLSDGGVLVRVHANLEGAVGNVDEVEEEIISQFTMVLENHTLEEANRLWGLAQQRIFAAKKRNSIAIYIHCTTHDDLMQLIDQLKSDILKGIIEKIFTEMLKIGDALRVTLTWSVEEFKRAAKFFERTGLTKGQSATPDMGNIVEGTSSDIRVLMSETSYRSNTLDTPETFDIPDTLDKMPGCETSTQTDEESFLEKKADSHEECAYLKKQLEQALDLNKSLIKAQEEDKRQIAILLEDVQRLTRKLGRDELSSRKVERRFEKKSNSVSLQTIRKGDGTKLIRGFAIFGKEMFVVDELSSAVDVYDLVNFSFNRRFNLRGLIDPLDIGSCNRNKCLYIFNFRSSLGKTNQILRVHPDGTLIQKWSTEDDYGFGLSVTEELSVILTVFIKKKLSEYSPDGQLIREINLSDPGIRYPWHAIKLTNGQFVITHGFGDLHRVCTVNTDGMLNKSFGSNPGSTIGQINRPGYLSVCGNGHVMVADQLNSRIVLLDAELKFKREILSNENHGLQNPWRALLNESEGRLLVADNELNEQRILNIDCNN